MVTKDAEQQLNLLCEQIHYTIPSVEILKHEFISEQNNFQFNSMRKTTSFDYSVAGPAHLTNYICALYSVSIAHHSLATFAHKACIRRDIP